jgi:hypothetical protein
MSDKYGHAYNNFKDLKWEIERYQPIEKHKEAWKVYHEQVEIYGAEGEIHFKPFRLLKAVDTNGNVVDVDMTNSEQFAESSYQRDKAKLKLEWITAELDLAIRKNPKEFGFSAKPTEGGIKNTLILNEKYQKALQLYNRKTRDLNAMTGVKTAFEHRKHALGNLVALKIGGFYSEPRNKIQDLKKIQSIKGQEERKKELNEKLKKRQNVPVK